MTPFRQFCEITRGIVSAGGVTAYNPTWLDPQTQIIRALGGLPDDIEHRIAAAEWAKEMNADTYYLAFADIDQVVVEHHANGAIIHAAKIVTLIEYAS